VIPIHAAGEHDGRAYIVMRFVDGRDLRAVIRHEGRLEPRRAARIVGQVADALDASHRAGLVHRDVKPSNILVTTFGAPVLADFGISSSLSRATADEVLAMSIPWSAPEVVAEETAGTVASEVWSLGATVYSLLAGHSPFERRERGQNTRDLLRKRIARANYVEIPRHDVPKELQGVLATAMSRDPGRRYASARAFGEALREVQSGLGLAPTPLEVPDADWSPASAPVDFGDSALRGPARSHIERELTRKARPGSGVAALVRDEDTDISAPARRGHSALPWLVGIGAGVVAGAAAVVAALLAAGVL
jgi:serine/threonine protein kinase